MENKYLPFRYFWRNPKNNPDGQDHQQDLNLLYTYGQLKSSVGIGGVVVRMRALFPKMFNKTKMAKFSGHIY